MRYPGFLIHRGQRFAALGIAALFLAGAGGSPAGAQPGEPTRAAGTALTQVRFLLRAECTCASCGFAMRDQIRKLPGVMRVDLSVRERTVSIAFDESRVPVSRVAATLASCEIGKHSALIGDLADVHPGAKPTSGAAPPIAGVRAAELEPKKGRLLVELADGAPMTTAELTAAVARAGITVRFNRGTQTASATAPARAVEPSSPQPTH